jgi:hypothetical protein
MSIFCLCHDFPFVFWGCRGGRRCTTPVPIHGGFYVKCDRCVDWRAAAISSKQDSQAPSIVAHRCQISFYVVIDSRIHEELSSALLARLRFRVQRNTESFNHWPFAVFLFSTVDQKLTDHSNT